MKAFTEKYNTLYRVIMLARTCCPASELHQATIKRYTGSVIAVALWVSLQHELAVSSRAEDPMRRCIRRHARVALAVLLQKSFMLEVEVVPRAVHSLA